MILGELSEAELEEEERLAEQREEALLQLKRDRAQRLAVKRGLSENPVERPRSAGAGAGSLRDAIPLRRGRSSTLQSQVSDDMPLRPRSSTLGSQSSGGVPSPRLEHRTPNSSLRNPSPRPPFTIPSPLPLQIPIISEPEATPEMTNLEPVATEDPKFVEFVQAPDTSHGQYK